MAGPSGLGCMKSFNSLVTCGREAFETARNFDMDANTNGINDTVRAGAEKVGLTQLDPVEAGRKAVIGDMVNMDRGMERRTKAQGMGM